MWQATRPRSGAAHSLMACLIRLAAAGSGVVGVDLGQDAKLVRGQHQLSTLSGTGGNQPGITGKRSAIRNRSSRGASRSAPAP